MIAIRVRLHVEQDQNVYIGVYVVMDTNSAQMAQTNSIAVSIIIEIIIFHLGD